VESVEREEEMKRPSTKLLKRRRNRTEKESIHRKIAELDLAKALKRLLDEGKGHILDATQNTRK
jgi:hypothetical protein